MDRMKTTGFRFLFSALTGLAPFHRNRLKRPRRRHPDPGKPTSYRRRQGQGKRATESDLRLGPARVEVFALTGQRVAMLHEGHKKAGFHRVHRDGSEILGRPLASGVYLYRLVTDKSLRTHKLTLLR